MFNVQTFSTPHSPFGSQYNRGKKKNKMMAAGNAPKGIARCEHCRKPCHKRCSRCRAFAVCGEECMKAAWGKHKADCNKVVEARDTAKQTGIELSGVPCMIDPEAAIRLNRRALDVYEKHGVSEPPGRGSTMDVGKKLAFFLDVLKEHDSSSPENRNLPLAEKMFLNRRFNNTYKHAMETFPSNELNRLQTMMKTHHIGAANQAY